MKKRLYDEYLRRLLEVNDESKTDDEHRQIEARFRGWLEGVEDAAGYRFNGDYYYIKLFDSGKMQERPLCCGVFLDWKSNNTGERPETRSERKDSMKGKQTKIDMELLNYVRRCKKKTGHDRHETLHAADNNTTFCGKELNEMWFIESNCGLEPDDVTCKECRRLKGSMIANNSRETVRRDRKDNLPMGNRRLTMFSESMFE